MGEMASPTPEWWQRSLAFPNGTLHAADPSARLIKVKCTQLQIRKYLHGGLKKTYSQHPSLWGTQAHKTETKYVTRHFDLCKKLHKKRLFLERSKRSFAHSSSFSLMSPKRLSVSRWIQAMLHNLREENPWKPSQGPPGLRTCSSDIQRPRITSVLLEN